MASSGSRMKDSFAVGNKKSSSTKGSKARQITVATPKTGTVYRSGASHPRYVPDKLLLEQLAGCPLGTLRLTGVVHLGPRSRRYVAAVCGACKKERWLLVDNVKASKSTNCT